MKKNIIHKKEEVVEILSDQEPIIEELKEVAQEKEAKKEIRPKKKAMVTKETEDDEGDSSTKKIRIKVIGIGGGGSNIVFELSKKLKDFSSQKIDFVAVNTDNQALGSISKNLKTLSFGNKVTNGLGCGSDVSLGERAAKEDIEKIKHLFSDNKDLYILISSLGGGTGTGAAPVFAKLANEMKLPTLSIFTLPFVFEGKKKTDYSSVAIEKLKEDVNAYMVLPNEKIFSLSKEEISFSEALSLLNAHLAGCLEGLFRTIYNPGLINIDWADIRTVIEGNKKMAYIDVVTIKSSQNLEEFAKNVLKNPILDYNFENADNIIFNIESSKDLSLLMLSQISEKISVHVPNARIIFGLTQNPKLKNEIRITIFSTISDAKGIEMKEIKQVTPKSKIKPVVKDGELDLEVKEPKKKEKKRLPKKEIEEESEPREEKDPEVIPIKEEEAEKVIENNQNDQDKTLDEILEEFNKEEELALQEEKIIRRNALETKELERLEREQEDSKEKIFDIPAFLRKEKDKKNK
jgi:cell division protein FtsZ